MRKNSIEAIALEGDAETLRRVVDWLETDSSIADEYNGDGWEHTPSDVIRILVDRIQLALTMRGEEN